MHTQQQQEREFIKVGTESLLTLRSYHAAKKKKKNGPLLCSFFLIVFFLFLKLCYSV